MGVATENSVDTTYTGGHFQIHVHAVMRDDDNDLGTFAAGLVDHLLHVFFLNTEGPVRYEVTGVRNRGIGESLPNDSHLGAVDFTDDVRFEDLVTKVSGFNVLGHNVNVTGKILVGNFHDALGAVGTLPVQGHDVNAKQLGGINHVLGISP